MRSSLRKRWLHSSSVGEQAVQLARVFRHVEALLRLPAAACTKPSSKLGIIQQALDCDGQSSHVTWFNEQAVFCVIDDLGDTSYTG
jgi:hypothetical protein